MKKCLKKRIFVVLLLVVLLVSTFLPVAADTTAAQGTSGGTWLFENEVIVAMEYRTDLPAPVEGEWYTVFVDGVEGGTALCYNNAVSLSTPDGHFVTYSFKNGWGGYKDITYTVSIRCDGSAIPEDPFNDPEAVWLFEDEEFVSLDYRADLPAPVDGELYTAFVDGVEVGTVLCCSSDRSILGFPTPDGHFIRYYVGSGWRGYKDVNYTVSIRCDGSAIPEDPFNNPEAVWLFKNEEFTEDRTDLPSPEVGKYYVLYVDGVASGIYCAHTDKGAAYVFWNVNGTSFYHQLGEWRTYSPEKMYPVTISVLELNV